MPSHDSHARRGAALRLACLATTALAITLALGACGDGATDPDLASHYQLVSVDGDPLPAPQGEGGAVIVDAELTFLDARLARSITFEGEEPIRDTVEYRREGSTVLMWRTQVPADTFSATLVGRELRWNVGSSPETTLHYVYRADP